MSSHWFETSRIAQKYSNSAEIDGEVVADYSTAILAYYDSINLDRRSIAISDDYALIQYETYQNPDPNWAAVMWMAYTVENMIIDMSDTGDTLKILSPSRITHPCFFNGDGDTGREYTFVNNWNLHHFEQFALTQPSVAARYPDARYSVVDEQDILDGSLSGTYDAVRSTPIGFFGPNTKLLDAYLDTLKVGGVMIWFESSEWTSMYAGGLARTHTSFYARFAKHLAAKTNFTVYHIPMEHGVTICKRTA
jgi:hypothetical protein